jgi:transcriptional regulator with XRE-family HTH domain
MVFPGDTMRYEVMKFENIRNLRIDKGYTQKQIGEYLGISQNTYSQYEIGVLNYPVDVLIKLADFYNVSIDYLLGRTNEKQPYPKK